MHHPCRVIKVGGSLLDLPDLPQRLRNWLAAESEAINVLIAGGGPYCELIRQADQRHRLGEQAAHWLCIRAMHTTAGLLASMLGCEEISDWNRLQQQRHEAKGPCLRVFDVARFLHDEEPRQPGRSLTHTWQVTSDSIAARVAELLAVDELVLLKSTEPSCSSLEQLAAAGYVDREFPLAASGCRAIRFVDLRKL